MCANRKARQAEKVIKRRGNIGYFLFQNRKPMYLFFDTETTGLPRNWRSPVTDLENWPRLVQLAYRAFDADGHPLCSGDALIKPEGFLIPPDAARIHGITTERAEREGKPLQELLQKFYDLAAEADVVVAHNIRFDEKIVGAELLRAGMENILASKRKICTMERTTDFCAIPGPYGYKWPKLAELYYSVFGTEFVELHDAALDVEATAKCFWELKRRGLIE